MCLCYLCFCERLVEKYTEILQGITFGCFQNRWVQLGGLCGRGGLTSKFVRTLSGCRDSRRRKFHWDIWETNKVKKSLLYLRLLGCQYHLKYNELFEDKIKRIRASIPKRGSGLILSVQRLSQTPKFPPPFFILNHNWKF